jgi:regulator of nucleoside diphosphate kinase
MNRTIFLTETDKQKLDNLLLTVRAPSSGDSLEEELARAEVVPSEQIPPNVVTMNSRVRFKDESAGKELVVTLVYPADADASSKGSLQTRPLHLVMMRPRIPGVRATALRGTRAQ